MISTVRLLGVPVTSLAGVYLLCGAPNDPLCLSATSGCRTRVNCGPHPSVGAQSLLVRSTEAPHPLLASPRRFQVSCLSDREK